MQDVTKLFSPEFLETRKQNPSLDRIIEMAEKGADPYVIIEYLCRILYKNKNSKDAG